MAMLGADISGLERLFSIQVEFLPEDHWQLELQPKDFAVAKGIESIVLSGAEVVSKLIIVSPGGDSSSIVFSNVLEKNSPDTAECLKFISANSEQCSS